MMRCNARLAASITTGFVSIAISSYQLGAQAVRTSAGRTSEAATTGSHTPVSTVNRFLSAIRERRIDEAKSLLAVDENSGKADPTLQEMLQLLDAFIARYLYGYEARPLAEKGDLALVQVRGRAASGDMRRDSIPLVREGGEWRLALSQKPVRFAGLMFPLPEMERDSVRYLLASMKSDLRNMVVVQEGFFSDSGRYAGGTTTNRGPTVVALAGFVPSAGVEVDVRTNGKVGWSATARRPDTDHYCTVFIGRRALPPATREGEPACTR